MQLKVKFMRWSAGRPVVILHKNLASKLTIHVDERVVVRKGSKKTIAVVDTAAGIISPGEVLVDVGISRQLNLKENDLVVIEPAPSPESIPLIYKKMQCKTLSEKEIHEIISEIVDNSLTESEIAYFVSAIYKCGMSPTEIKDMIRSIVDTGKTLNVKGRLIADKHSIGGIPGRTTPIVVSICVAAGLTIPKTSSRAITSPAGTADSIEVLCKVDFSINDIKNIVARTGGCLVWGGSLGLAPADDKIIQVERLLNLDPEAQLLASIMAKKISVGSKYLLIDIPYGRNAKVNQNEAEKLKRKFEALGKSFNIKVKCLLSKTDEPLGNGIGPALEIRDAIKVLLREDPCFMLESRSVKLAGALLELTKKAKPGMGEKMAQNILDSGKAFDKFEEIIRAQKGSLKRIPESKFNMSIISDRDCKIKDIDVKKINSLARLLGCPADKASGIFLHKHIGDKIKKGERIMTFYGESRAEIDAGLKFYKKNKPIILR